MNDSELERLEADLRRVVPARPPDDFLARLKAARPDCNSRPLAKPTRLPSLGLRPWLLRWLIPATAMMTVGLVVWRVSLPAAKAAPALKADNVQIDQELLSAFDTVARLPSGEPVRFRCRTWMDQVVLTDKQRGVVIEQRTPRIEVVPVRFETY